MCNGSAGSYGNPGNEESISCRGHWDFQGSNPTLTASLTLIVYKKTGKLLGNFGQSLLDSGQLHDGSEPLPSAVPTVLADVLYTSGRTKRTSSGAGGRNARVVSTRLGP
jgi:hypothetical protein